MIIKFELFECFNVHVASDEVHVPDDIGEEVFIKIGQLIKKSIKSYEDKKTSEEK